METLKALKIAKREWKNIGVSLEMCGDIGEFDSKDCYNTELFLLSEGSLLTRNLIDMEKKFPAYCYVTPEAAYVFAVLASRAGERLGLKGRRAKTFGSVYSWFRTGYFLSDETEKLFLRHINLLELFFLFVVNPAWSFDSLEAKVKIKTVFSKFLLLRSSEEIGDSVQTTRLRLNSFYGCNK